MINPIDLSPFIGASQNAKNKNKKLIQLYLADAQKLLDKGDTEAYNLIMEKIKKLQTEDNNQNSNN